MKLTPQDLDALQAAIDENFEVEYTPFMDGFGHEMWRVHNNWAKTLPEALQFARDDLNKGTHC